jgi:N6-adenosine-specific RNA methylase IME4
MTNFAPLPRGPFATILADPPWKFVTWSNKGQGRGAVQHYPTLAVDEIARLPVNEIAARDCVLFLWATWPMVKEALHLMEWRWKFRFKTCAFVWVKVTNGGDPAQGLGFWTRSNTEFVMLGTRGRPKRRHKDVGQVIMAPRSAHSRKPEEAYERIERLCEGPYLELFARGKPRPGWKAWGNELEA